MFKLFLFSFLFFLFFSCSSSGSKNEEKAGEIVLEDFEKYESQIVSVERMDTFALEDRIKVFEEEGRLVQYFAADWKITTEEEAVFISTIKLLEEDLFILRDYYINGNNQSTGIYKALKKNIDWTNINEWGSKDAEARRVGKFVWFENGKIYLEEHYEYVDFEKGYGSSTRKEYSSPRKSRPVKAFIKKDSL